jgi:hypothetical protein
MIRVTLDGVVICELQTAAQLDALVANGVVPASAVAEMIADPVTAADVRAEASRRMQSMFGARDGAHLEQKIANASREAIRLLRIKADRAWTAEEAGAAAALEGADALVEAIRAASNAMEASPPADYADDAHWP